MKLIQSLYPCNQAWTEVFYDGELLIVDNIATIPKGKEHWCDILIIERGFTELKEEEVAKASPSKAKTTPKKEPVNVTK